MKFPVWCQHVFCSCLGWSSFLAFINTCAWPLCRLWGLRLIRRFMMSLCRPLHFPNRFGRFQSVIVTIVRSVILSALIMANHVASQHDFDRPSLVFFGISIFIGSAQFGDGLFSSRRPLLGNSPLNFARLRIPIITSRTSNTIFFRSSLMHQQWESIFLAEDRSFKDSPLNLVKAANSFSPSFQDCHLPIPRDMLTLPIMLSTWTFLAMLKCLI